MNEFRIINYHLNVKIIYILNYKETTFKVKEI
jgi:hypothetical protein